MKVAVAAQSIEISRSNNKYSKVAIDIAEKRSVYFDIIVRQEPSLQLHEFSRITTICLLPRYGNQRELIFSTEVNAILYEY